VPAEAAIDAAIAGLGIKRVLSYQIANAARTGALTVVLQEFEPAPSARQSRLHGSAALAAEAAGLPRFRDPAAEGAAL
jgi:hypothetical protein